MSLLEFIKKSPKAELHLHIEGTLEPEQMFELAKRNNIQIPFKNINEVKEAYNFSNLESFLKIYYEGAKVLINEEDFFDLTWAKYPQKSHTMSAHLKLGGKVFKVFSFLHFGQDISSWLIALIYI